MGGAPMSWGHDPQLLETEATGGHNLGIPVIYISHIALIIRLYTNVNAVSSLFWRVGHGALRRHHTN